MTVFTVWTVLIWVPVLFSAVPVFGVGWCCPWYLFVQAQVCCSVVNMWGVLSYNMKSEYLLP